MEDGRTIDCVDYWHLSNTVERTKEMCTPIRRWVAEQSESKENKNKQKNKDNTVYVS